MTKKDQSLVLRSMTKVIALLLQAPSSLSSTSGEGMNKLKEAVAALLRLIPVGAYGTALFEALCRLTFSIAITVAHVRQGPNGYQVLLRQRGPKETYPNQWHLPGAYLRPMAGAVRFVIHRIMKETKTSQWVVNWLGILFHKEARGWLCEFLFTSEDFDIVGDDQLPENIRWFNLDEAIALGPALVRHHHRFMKAIGAKLIGDQETIRKLLFTGERLKYKLPKSA